MRGIVAVVVGLTLGAAGAWAAEGQDTRILAEFGAPGEWVAFQWNAAKGTAAPAAEFPQGLATAEGDVRQSLALAISWGGGGDFQFFAIEPRGKQTPIPYRVTEVGLWLKGSNTAHGIEIHFADAAGKEVKVGAGRTDFGDWRRLSARIPNDWAQPLTLKSIVFHNWDARKAATTTIYAARLEALLDPAQRVGTGADAPSLAVVPANENGLAGDDGRDPVILRVSRWRTEEQALEIRHRLVDWQGKAVLEEKIPVVLRGRWSRRAELTLPAYGSFAYTVELCEPGGKVLQKVERRLARVVPVPRLTAEQRAKSPMGVNGHQGTPWPTLARLGIHWGRDYSWGWLAKGETAPIGNGVDFGALWRAADAAGITLLPITQATFRNATNTGFLSDTGAIQQAFTRLGKAFPDIPFWELDNEAELGFPGHRFDMVNYRAFIRAAAAGLRAAGRAEVALNGTAGIRYDDTVSLVKGSVAKEFSVVNYHYYSGTVPPEICDEDINAGQGRAERVTFTDQLRRVNRAAHAAGKEAWLSEIGWDVTNGPAVGERLQAMYLARAYLLARLCGTDKIFWFYDRDVPNSNIIFSTCGLVDLNGDLRPSAAAMAALSKETALATVGGSVDLGDDCWCALFRQPAGKWVAAVWSVKDRHPLPAELARAAGMDLFGNPVQKREVSPEVAYYHLDALPLAWEAQRRVELLSPLNLPAAPGSAVKVVLASPDPATKVTLQGLPAKITAGAWARDGEPLACSLTCAPDLAPGLYPVRIIAAGTGWQRRWQGQVSVVPPVVSNADAYTPGELAILKLRPALEQPVAVKLDVPAQAGAVLPAALMLQPGREVSVAFQPAEGVAGPVAITAKTAAGAEQTLWLRPRALAVPRLPQPAADGDLREWPEAGKLDARCLVPAGDGFSGEARFAWSDEGLCVAARVPIKGLKDTNPREFWAGTAIEVFVDTAGEEGEGWGGEAHQFWISPVREGAGWRAYVGEWKRSSSVPDTVYDDKRCKAAVRVAPDGFVVEMLIPAAALGGRTPKAGDTWRGAISITARGAAEVSEGGWPQLKSRGILDGSGAWGTLRFGQ